MADLLDTVEPKPLKIVKLIAENIKKLTAVSITPDGNVVSISGANGAGKSSTLDSIVWAIAGTRNIQATPIRKGQDRAVIKLDMGEVVVTRTFTKGDDGDYLTSLKVTAADGTRIPQQQEFLGSIIGSLSIDPLAFSRMKDKERFDVMKAFVKGYDFDAGTLASKKDYERRTEVNHRAKELRAQADAIAIPDVVPKERVDEEALLEEIASVGSFNAELERRAERRTGVAAQATGHREDAAEAQQRAADLRKQADALDAQAAASIVQATELEERIAAAPPLDAKKDAAEVRARLDAAKRTNAIVDQAARRDVLLADAKKTEDESAAITARIDAREEEKRAAIAAAKLPVDGITFADEAIQLNGVPFEQASDAEKLRASVAIAMANRGRLSVIRVRDGSLLDKNGMRLLAEMADKHDCQVWMEVVDDSGEVGFVIEDGHVASTPATRRARKPAVQQAAE